MDWLREKYPHFKTREFDSTIPEFHSHDEARKWFKNQFGNNFMMTGSDHIDDRKIYFYVLVVNRKDWEEYTKYLEEQNDALEKGNFNDFQKKWMNTDITERGMFSNHKVEIWEDGNVHVVY